MAAVAKTIVVAGVAEDLARMSELLAQQGFVLHPCADGASALELGLKLRPALMLVDTAVPLLSAAKLSQILRANPHTADLAFFFVGREGEEVEGFSRHRDRFVSRPFNPEQLLASILGHFGRRERTEQVGRQQKQIEGSLSQISLVDLLQILGLNRKDGVLNLDRGTERGAIYMVEGSVINARVGAVEGEKAFFRLLRWEDGKFWFAPGGAETEVRIAAPLDHLIMEGLRQIDEMVSQAAILPAPETQLVLKVAREHLPPGLRPSTQEILLLLEHYRRVQEILDRCTCSDYEALQVIKVLLDKEIVEERREVPLDGGERIALLTPAEIIAVRDHMGERGALLERTSAKLILLTPSPAELHRFLQTLQSIDEFESEDDFLAGGIRLTPGDIGRLAVAETFTLRLFFLPADVVAAPLWTPFCRRMFGVVSLAHDDALRQAEEFFSAEARTPVARIAGPDGAGGDFPLRPGDRQALRNLLAFFAARYLGSTPLKEGP